jgi:drug/metabolite transporter (DMT)-like permease
MQEQGSLGRGALYMTAAAVCFAVMGLAVKLLSHDLGNARVVFLRNALGLVALVPWLLRLGLTNLATRKPGEHALRALAGLLSMYCFFFAIGHMRLADAVLLNYSSPLFVPVFAWLRLGEPIPRGLWKALLAGFAGIALVLKPGLGLFEPVALWGVASATFAALAQVGVRRLTATEPVTRIVFYFALLSTLLSAAPLPFLGRWPATAPWATLLVLGVSATLGQLCLTWGYSQAPAAQVGPFIYVSVPSAALLEGLLFGSWPDASSAVGAALIALAGILTLRAKAGPTD